MNCAPPKLSPLAWLLIGMPVLVLTSGCAGHNVTAWWTDQLIPADATLFSGRFSNANLFGGSQTYMTNEASPSGLLWTMLTKKPSAASDTILVEMDRRYVWFMRLKNGQAEEEQRIGYKQKGDYLVLRKTVHSANPTDYAVVWVWGMDNFALGVTNACNLTLNVDRGGLLVLGILPLFAAGGDGPIYEFERIDDR